MDFDSEIGSHDIGYDSDWDGNPHVAHQAAASGDIPRLMRAIKHDPEVIQQKDTDGLTPLAHAIHNKQMAVVKRLVKMGADIDRPDSKGRTGLAIAAYQGWYEGVVYLLRKGAKPTVTDKTGRTPLHAATYDPDIRSLSAILKRLPTNRINAMDNEKMTALHWAAFHDRPEHVRLLLQKGADPMMVDIDRKTALHWAAQNGSRNCCQQLTQHDGRREILQLRDSAGKTVLHLVAAAGNAAAIEDLVRHDSTLLEAEDEDDRRPLHWAAATGHAECVRALLRLGVCPNPMDVDGMSPLEYAQQAGHIQCVQQLKAATSDGKTKKQSNDSKDVSDKLKVTSNNTLAEEKTKISSLQSNETKLPVVVVGKGPTGKTGGNNSLIGDKGFLDLSDDLDVNATNEGRSETPEVIIGRRKKQNRRKHCRRKLGENGSSPVVDDVMHVRNVHCIRPSNPDIRTQYLSPMVDGPLSPGQSAPSSLSLGPDGNLSRQRELSPLRVRALSKSPYQSRLPPSVAQLRLDEIRTPTPPPFISLSARKVLPSISPSVPDLRSKDACARMNVQGNTDVI